MWASPATRTTRSRRFLRWSLAKAVGEHRIQGNSSSDPTFSVLYLPSPALPSRSSSTSQRHRWTEFSSSICSEERGTPHPHQLHGESAKYTGARARHDRQQHTGANRRVKRDLVDAASDTDISPFVEKNDDPSMANDKDFLASYFTKKAIKIIRYGDVISVEHALN
ncbi:hypothetical protein BS78_05G175500 [Paspalum vaginatum]|nr:hypothetical protein BS78_05G175500 [Paspalum vaginatum]